jgi:hypothetical protein
MHGFDKSAGALAAIEAARVPAAGSLLLHVL